MRDSKRKPRYYPVPEAIDGGQWEFATSPSMADIKQNPKGGGGTLTVPLDESERSRYLRFREQAHIKYTPKQLRRIPEELPRWLLDAAEDGRITELIERDVGFGMETRGLRDSEAEYLMRQALEQEDSSLLAGLLYAHKHTEDDRVLSSAVHQVLGDFHAEKNQLAEELALLDESTVEAQQLTTALQGKIKEINKLVARYSKIMDLVEDVRAKHLADAAPTSLRNFQKATVEAAQELLDGSRKIDGERQRSDEGDAKDKARRDGEESAEGEDIEEGADQLEQRGLYRDEGDGKWGQIEVFTYPLPQRLPVRLRQQVRQATDRGQVPRNMHRWCSDQMIFATKRRKHGGSVLIDVSGSMEWEHEELMEVIALMPAGIVACYSGGVLGGKKTDDPHGFVRIVGLEGRFIAKHQDVYLLPDGRHAKALNMVDGPALRWLGKQPAPRYWVSDGFVTGINPENGNQDHPSHELLKDAARICRTERILRLDGLDEVRDRLAQGAIR